MNIIGNSRQSTQYLLSANTAVPEQESHKILDMLIDDHQIKDLFVANNNSNKLGLPLTIATQKN